MDMDTKLMLMEANINGYTEGLKDSSKIEPCDDAISRQAVLDGIEKLKQSPWATDKRGNGFEYLITEALDIVADLCVKQEPSVRPKSETVTEFADRCRECGAKYGKLLEQKTGHWIKENPFMLSECSECGNKAFGYNGFDETRTDYCPSCGAYMVKPTCDTCEYNTAAFNPCNACKDKSEYEPQESKE